MLNFRNIEQLDENRNTHLTHIEETIITDGYDGAVNAINFLKEVGGMLSGNTRSSTNITTKWDGALLSSVVLIQQMASSLLRLNQYSIKIKVK